MTKKTDETLLKLAKKTARKVRRQRLLPGWHESDIDFPRADYEDVVEMLREAYRLGEEAGRSQAR